MGHFDYLKIHLKLFLSKLKIEKTEEEILALIREHGSAYYLFEDTWNNNNIKFEHGVSIAIASQFEPFYQTYITYNISVGEFVNQHFTFFRRFLLSTETDVLKKNRV